MSIRRWKCRLPGDHEGPVWPMVCVDWQSEAEYALYGDLPERKTYIFHDGSVHGRRQAEYLASCLDESGRAVRDLGRPGIVAIVRVCAQHVIYEIRPLGVVHA